MSMRVTVLLCGRVLVSLSALLQVKQDGWRRDLDKKPHVGRTQVDGGLQVGCGQEQPLIGGLVPPWTDPSKLGFWLHEVLPLKSRESRFSKGGARRPRLMPIDKSLGPLGVVDSDEGS